MSPALRCSVRAWRAAAPVRVPAGGRDRCAGSGHSRLCAAARGARVPGSALAALSAREMLSVTAVVDVRCVCNFAVILLKVLQNRQTEIPSNDRLKIFLVKLSV